MLNFALKLKRLKGVLREWNKTTVGNIFDKLLVAEQRLKDMECAFDTSGSDQDLIRLNHAQAEHLRALADEESFWKQRARVKWLHDGDRNTKFFHASTVEKRSRLRITRIKDDAGHWLEEASQISQHAVDFFIIC